MTSSGRITSCAWDSVCSCAGTNHVFLQLPISLTGTCGWWSKQHVSWIAPGEQFKVVKLGQWKSTRLSAGSSDTRGSADKISSHFVSISESLYMYTYSLPLLMPAPEVLRTHACHVLQVRGGLPAAAVQRGAPPRDGGRHDGQWRHRAARHVAPHRAAGL